MGLESSEIEFSLFRKAVQYFGYEKVGVLDKKMWEGQFAGESE